MAALVTGYVGAAPLRFAVDSGGQVYAVNGIDPPVVWDGVGTSLRNWGMVAPAVPTLGATAAGVLTGTYYWQVTWYNANTGEYGAPSGFSASATLTAQQQTVNRPTVAGIDPQVTHWRLWRSTSGQAGTFYKVTDQTIATASYADNIADAVIGAGTSLDSHYPPDASKPFIRFYKGRFVLYGGRVESTGTAATTSGGPAVVGTGTNFRQSHVGQRFYIAGEAVYYSILSVTDATHLTLSTNYVGTTAGGKSFKIVPVRPSDVAWSQADSESFDLLGSAGVFPADGDFPAGIEIIGTSLILFKKSHAYMFDYGSNPNPLTGSGNLSQVLMSRGLIRQECCIPVGQSAYCLDSQGIYQFDGTSQEQPIDQGIRRYFQPDDEIPAVYRVNRAYSETWHGTYDQKTDQVIFFVTTGTETQPQTALCWSRERERWTVHKFMGPLTASCHGVDSTGEYRAWVADPSQWLWALSGTRQAEGNSTGTLEGTATAVGAATLTDGAATFPTAGNGLKGVYASIVGGTGAGQNRLITSNTGTQITAASNWSPALDTTSQYLIGGIESLWKSVWHFIEPTGMTQLRRIALLFEPNAVGRNFKVRFYKDFVTTPITKLRVSQSKDGLTIPATVASDGWCYLDGSLASGRIWIEFPDNLSTCLAVELGMFGANEPILVRGYDLEGVMLPVEFS